MILTGPEVISAIHRQEIEIAPFEPGNVNAASIDLRLGSKIAVYKRWVYLPQGSKAAIAGGQIYSHNDRFIDCKNADDFEVHFLDIPDEGIILRPGILYLMHTVEEVYTRKFVPVLDGKSSLGRLGVLVHLTAGYGDPGFSGQYTLEVSVMHPVKVYAGMRFCQMRFHTTVGSSMSYQQARGNYTGEDALGPVASKVYTQFQK